MSEKKKEWFVDWFNSTYYHLLYSHRDNNEAKVFIDNLATYFNFQTGEKALDIPCGKGRHSIYLHKKGLHVTGADLSVESIKAASSFLTPGLNFRVQDMRQSMEKESFHYVFNLFTSFGYFESDSENEMVIKSFLESLVSGGYLVIDFLNATKVMKGLIEEEKKKIDGVEFFITRKIENGKIEKQIRVIDEGRELKFKECVKSFTKEDFLRFFENTGLSLVKLAGDYSLNPYSAESDRLILIAKKV